MASSHKRCQHNIALQATMCLCCTSSKLCCARAFMSMQAAKQATYWLCAQAALASSSCLLCGTAWLPRVHFYCCAARALTCTG